MFGPKQFRKCILKTVFGKFIKSCALRDNHIVDHAHIEYYEVRLPKGGNMSKYDFKQSYKMSCSHLGYNHQL